MSDRRLREDICFWVNSEFDRTLTCDASGNISVQIDKVVHEFEVDWD